MTAFDASTGNLTILWQPSSYPFCTLAGHRLDSTPHVSFHLASQPDNSLDVVSPPPTDGGNTASRQAEQANNIIEPPLYSNPTTTSQIGASSHDPDMAPLTNPIHSSSRPTGSSPTAVVTATPQDITSIPALSHPLEGSERQDSYETPPSVEPGSGQILSTLSTYAPTPTLALIPTSLPNTLSESYDAGVATVSNSPHFAPPSIGSFIPTSRPTGSATLPRLRARGLADTRNMCFVNAVLQLLVNSRPPWNLFRDLSHLKVRRGAGVPETGDDVTPLVDATVRFFNEFIIEEESPSTQRQLQPDTGGTSRAEEDKKDYKIVDSFEPTYLYDAMKDKRQLRSLLVCSLARVVASCY